MTAPLTKKQLIFKIHKEQGVDVKSLERMNVPALMKMDAAIPDEGDLLGGPSELPSVEQNTVNVPSSEVASSPETVGEPLPDILGAVSGNTAESGQEQSEGTELGSAVPSENGTPVVGEVAEGGVQVPPSETPFPSNELEIEEGQGDASESIPPAAPTERILIGEHPATGEPVYSDEQ